MKTAKNQTHATRHTTHNPHHLKTASKSNPFARAIQELLPTQPGPNTTHPPLALALSGGVDSILLAHSLHAQSIPFIALHFNHRWRERASDDDAKWLAAWCEERAIPLHIGRAKKKGPASENQARTERWTFFKKTCRALSIPSIWTAHHADDLVETFLLQLLRGAGPDGLTSLAPCSSMHGLETRRPWLGFWKEEILARARSLNLTWREDATNQQAAYARNRLRLHALPALQKAIGRDPRPMIYRTAQIITDENSYWQELFPKKWPAQVPVRELAAQPIAWQRRALRGWLKSQGVGNLNFDTIEAVRALLTQPKPSQVNLQGGLFCRRQKSFLWIITPHSCK